MDSSISHSRFPIPWTALRLLLALGAAFLLSIAYLFYGNPEIGLYKEAIRIKQAWAKQLTRQYGNKTVIYGGSSCAFSIDGERLLKRDRIAAVNMGLHAGLKPTMLTNWALSETRPGDTLIVAIEPGLLAAPLDSSPLAIQLSVAAHSIGWLEAPWLDQPFTKASLISALRPSGYHVFVMLGKIVKGLPPYRYSVSDIHPSGWMTTAERRSFGGGGEDEKPVLKLSHEAENLLRWLRDWAASHHVRLAYSLPWSYAAPSDLIGAQKNNIYFLRQVEQYLPVLKDPVMGACSTREYFADTPNHLTSEGAALRTDSLAQQLKTWEVWKEGELEVFSRKFSEKGGVAETSRIQGM